MRVKIKVTGIVQGVGFRPFIYRIAVKNGLNGYVRNRGDAGVEILLEGEEKNIKCFLKDLGEKKPPLAQIYELITSPLKRKNEYENFKIYKSSEEAKLSGSVIPPDIAICDECLKELRIQRIRDTTIFLSLAQIVVLGIRLLIGFLTIGKAPPWRIFLCVVSATASM